MTLIEHEIVIAQSPSCSIVLTNCRVLQEGKESAIHIMLEDVCCCSLIAHSKPKFIWFAILALLLSVGIQAYISRDIPVKMPSGAIIDRPSPNASQAALAPGVVISGVLIIAYFATRRAEIDVASAAGTITERTRAAKGIKADSLAFLELIQAAKNARRLGCALGALA